MRKAGLIFFAVSTLLFNFCRAQEIINGGFETVNSKTMPRNWVIDNKNDQYSIGLDALHKHLGKYAVKVDGTALKDTVDAFVYNGFGTTSATKIQTIEVSGWVQTSSVADSAAALIIQDLKGEKMIRSYLSISDKSDMGWHKLNLKFTTDANAPWYGFYYGFEVSSKTVIWLDDISIKVDGKLIQDPLSSRFEPGKENINWLNAHLYSLKSTNIIPSHADLEPIGKLCNDATIVGLGEPTHGTKEAFQFKLRLLEYLVTKKGFNTIALEEVIPTCDIMNAVLNNTPTIIKDSLVSLPFYKCWKTAEVNDMLDWVSDYNSKHIKKVKFIGMDMEDIRCRSSRRLLNAYGKLYNKTIYSQSLDLDKQIDSLLVLSIKNGQERQTLKLADSIKALLSNMQQSLNSAGISNGEQLFKLKTYIRVCEQWLNSRFYDGNRDEFMADNIAFYSKSHPNDKVLVWAHDFHIANAAADGAKQMGAYLKASFGKEYVPIGFTSAQGTYTAATDRSQKHWDTFQFETAYKGTYEYILAKAKSSFYFLPLNNMAATQQKEAFWLNIPMKHLDVPYIQSGGDDYRFYGNMNTVFDGVVFYKTSSASGSYLKM